MLYSSGSRIYYGNTVCLVYVTVYFTINPLQLVNRFDFAVRGIYIYIINFFKGFRVQFPNLFSSVTHIYILAVIVSKSPAFNLLEVFKFFKSLKSIGIKNKTGTALPC